MKALALILCLVVAIGGEILFLNQRHLIPPKKVEHHPASDSIWSSNTYEPASPYPLITPDPSIIPPQ